MLKYILRRLLVLIPVLFLVTILISSLIYFSPGDPVRVMLGIRANEEAVAAIRAELGLDKPYYLRYLQLAGQCRPGEIWGALLQRNEKVSDLIAERLPATLEMMRLCHRRDPAHRRSHRGRLGDPGQLFRRQSVFVLFPLLGLHAGILDRHRGGPALFHVLGHLSHLRPRRADLDGRPVSTTWPSPGLILGIRQVALISRLIRASMLEILNEDFIRTARSKGLAERVVVYKHAFRNALIPTVTIFGIQIPEMISLGVIIETVFAWPGTGRMLVDAVLKRDYTLVQGIVLVYSLLVILMSLLVDILYGYIDPRIKRDGPETEQLPAAGRPI